MKKAIINFANNKGRYLMAQDRLKQSLIKQGFDGDFISWQNEEQIGAPPHTSNPYAFKTFAFNKAFDMGYDSVVLLDASCVAVAPLTPIFDKVEKDGYIMQEAGQIVGTWTNDNALRYFGLTRDKAMHLVMYGNAGFLGLSKRSNTAMEFLTRWHKSSTDGAFIGAWDNKMMGQSQDTRCKGHRHDMSCGSIIANDLKMEYVKGDEWLHYAPPEQAPKEGVIIHAQGL